MLSEFRACPRIGFQFPIIFLFGWGAPIVAQGVMGDFVQQEEREKEIRFSSSSEARGRIEPAFEVYAVNTALVKRNPFTWLVLSPSAHR